VIFLVTVPPTTLAFLTSCARAGVRPHVPATIATRGAEGALRDRIAQAGPAEAAVVCLAHGADSVFQRPARDVRQAFDEIGAGFLFSAARDPAGQPPPGVAQDVPSPYTVPVAGAWVARYDAALAHLDWLIAHPLPPGVHPGRAAQDRALRYCREHDAGGVAVDWRCRVFQSLYSGGDDVEAIGAADRPPLFYNTSTLQVPCILHGDGGYDMRAIVAALRLG
jgi:hypothetical protein